MQQLEQTTFSNELVQWAGADELTHAGKIEAGQVAGVYANVLVPTVLDDLNRKAPIGYQALNRLGGLVPERECEHGFKAEATPLAQAGEVFNPETLPQPETLHDWLDKTRN